MKSPACHTGARCGYREGVRWSRLPASRLHPAVVVSGLVFALAGLMFVAAATSSQGTDLRAERATELRDLVRQKSTRVQDLQDRVGQQQQLVDDLAAGRIGDPAVVRARTEIAALAPQAGLTPIAGRGLVVSLDDAPARDPEDPLSATISANDVIVHQADVQAVVNALWRGGAVAVQLMDQRLISTSSIQCVGNTLLLHGRVYSPPYTVSAVGPRARMRASLREDEAISSYRSWAAVVGLGYQVRSVARVTVPAFVGPVTMAYATSDPGPTSDPGLATPSTEPTQ